MSDKSVAYRYAKPLLSLAEEKGLLEEVNRDMNLVHNTCDEHDQLRAVLRNPVIRGYKKLSILKAVFGNHLNPLTMSMLEIIAKRSREEIIYEITREFTLLYNEYKGIQIVTLVTTVPLAEDLKAELISKLNQTLGKTIILKEEINPSLIGGFILKIGNSQIDDSIQSSLQRLKMNFIHRIYS